jgi:hypothetical protein
MFFARIRQWSLRAFSVGAIGVLTLAAPVSTVGVGAATTGTVAGRVIDGNGRGVAGLRVGVPGASIGFTTTDANGNYSIAGVPTSGSQYDVYLLAGCGRDQIKQVTVDGGTETVNFTVGAPLKVAGYTCTVSVQPYVLASSTAHFEGDDGNFAAYIGFDFPYFGSKRDDFVTVDYNGNLRLPQSASSNYVNAPIPQADAPNGVIAPFWDDILFDQYSVFGIDAGGTAPHRYRLLEWRNVLFQDGAPGERVSFEVFLYEDGRIIFNYDGINPSSAHNRMRGSGATVGIESPDGTKGVARSFNRPVLDNGLAIVFTPAPK